MWLHTVYRSDSSACRALVLAALLLAGTFGATASHGDDRINAFNRAYSSYQTHAEAGNFHKALPEAKKALEIGKELFGPEDERTANLYYNYGDALKQTYNSTEARKPLKRTLELYEKLYGEESPELITILMDYGDVAASGSGGLLSQKRHLNRALRIAESEHGAESAEYGWLLVSAGERILSYSRSTEARRYLEKGHALLSRELGESHTQTGFAAFNLGKLALSGSRHEEAKEHFFAALDAFSRDRESPTSLLELSTRSFLVRALEELGERDLATEHCLAIGRATPYTPDQDYEPLYKKAPIYPSVAQARGQEAQLLVEYTVDKQGFVRDPVVLSRDGHSVFESAAKKALAQWRYAPRFVDGEPVDTENVQHIITFELGD